MKYKSLVLLLVLLPLGFQLLLSDQTKLALHAD